MAHLDQKRSHSRVDVYMKFLKQYAGKHIFQLDDKDVLNFLVFKDVNNSGKTIVHHRSCPNLGLSNINQCLDKDLCSKRHTANSMRIGIVQKLRKGFEEEAPLSQLHVRVTLLILSLLMNILLLNTESRGRLV